MNDQTAPRSPLPVLIDTDPGIDDMLALFLALGSPELDVRGISVSYGNTVAENAYRNAVAIVRRAGKRTTLGVGARRPLARPLSVASDTHGESGLGYAAVPPAGVILDFVKSLDRLLADQSEPVTLVTLGPVTSLALALRRDAALVRDKVKRHIAMIGNVAAQGNTTRYAEFNYTVQYNRVVQPGAWWVTHNVGYERLVLSACNPLYSAAQRIIIFARLKSVTPLGPARKA